MLQLFLFLHVLGAIAVFGPVFMFPVITSQARKSPQNFPFAVTLSEYIERRIVIPGAIVQGITGILLIGILQVNPLTNAAYHWLIPGIALYLVAIVFAITVQAKNASSASQASPFQSGTTPSE